MKCAKLTTKTKKQRLKIWSRDWIFKNTIFKKEEEEKKKEKTNKQTKNKATRIINNNN